MVYYWGLKSGDKEVVLNANEEGVFVMRLVGWVSVAHTLKPFTVLGPGLKPLKVLTHRAGQRPILAPGRLSRPAVPPCAQK